MVGNVGTVVGGVGGDRGGGSILLIIADLHHGGVDARKGLLAVGTGWVGWALFLLAVEVVVPSSFTSARPIGPVEYWLDSSTGSSTSVPDSVEPVSVPELGLRSASFWILISEH